MDTAIVSILEAGRSVMKRVRRVFTDEFKQEAVRLSLALSSLQVSHDQMVCRDSDRYREGDKSQEGRNSDEKKPAEPGGEGYEVEAESDECAPNRLELYPADSSDQHAKNQTESDEPEKKEL